MGERSGGARRLGGAAPADIRRGLLGSLQKHIGADEHGARRLSEYLHDLGVFLHFQKNPLLRRLVILSNEWATEAVFAVVNDRGVRRQKGRFTQDDYERFWGAAEYQDRHPELLQLLEQFEFSYRLDGPEPAWLVPQLLPSEPDDSLADWRQPGISRCATSTTSFPEESSAGSSFGSTDISGT